MQKKIDYNGMLLDLIPIRKQFKSFSGSEGVAYFVSPKYVLKEYTKSDDWKEFDKVFDAYCSELQRFSRSGKQIANIYAWQKVPNIGYYTKGDKNFFQYFILEERVPGRELYVGYLEDAFSIVSDLCEETEFKNAIKNGGSESLFKEIVFKYVSDYIQMNEFLESLSDAELSKFIEDAYMIYRDGESCYPDMFPHNILVDKKNKSLKMIDLFVRTDSDSLKTESIDSYFIKELSGLFLYNCFPNKPEKYLTDRMFDYSTFDDVSKKNTRISKQIISKMFALSNLICDRPKVNKRDLTVIEESLSMMFDDEDVREIESGLNLE